LDVFVLKMPLIFAGHYVSYAISTLVKSLNQLRDHLQEVNFVQKSLESNTKAAKPCVRRRL